MPFELEVIEAALISRIHRLEHGLLAVDPRVAQLLDLLPNRLTADVLEELRLSKQTLVELGSRAGALKQMLLDLLDDPQVICRIYLIGRTGCVLCRGEDARIECEAVAERQVAEQEEEEIEMLLENYLQRCESCHGQAERLLDSAREMEDSIAVNLSSRRLEVSRVELLLQVGTFSTRGGDFWDEFEVLPGGACLCLLAYDGRDFGRRRSSLLHHVSLFECEEDFIAMAANKRAAFEWVSSLDFTLFIYFMQIKYVCLVSPVGEGLGAKGRIYLCEDASTFEFPWRYSEYHNVGVRTIMENKA